MSAAQWEVVSPASAMPNVEKAAGALIVSVSYAKKCSLGAAVEYRACSKIGGAAMSRAVAFLAAGCVCISSAYAADLRARPGAPAPAAEIMEVPGEDIFGFTSATDVGKPGDKGVALESDGAVGTRDGRYRGLAQKLEFSRTFADNWSYAASLFGAGSSLRGNGDFADRSGYNFDGMSIEVRHRLIERSLANPFALTLAVEPRWSRMDGFSGRVAPAYGAEFKAQIDAPIADRWFWGMNATFGVSRGRDPLDRSWSTASESSLSTAVAYAFVEDKFWIGAEARWEQSWSEAFFGRLEGQALFFGPTIAFKPAANVTLNLVALPQIAGKARGVSNALDLDNFERAKFRVKLAVGF